MNSDDTGNLSFRARPGRRPSRRASRSSTLPWLVVAAISGVLFVMVVRALLERTAWTAGPSPVPAARGSQDAAPAGHADLATSYVNPKPVPMVYRCVDRAGGVAFQSEPCGPHQRMTRAVSAPPDVEPARYQAATRPRASSTSATAFSGAGISEQRRELSEIRCAMARRHREQTLEQIGLRRTYDLLQNLDAMVAEACKGA